MKPLFISIILLSLSTSAFSRALENSMDTSASAMKAQSERIKIITENIANSDTTADYPGGDPYRRKTIAFENKKDKITGANLVEVKKIGKDNSDFKLEYSPNHPAANAEGYVKFSNVERNLESIDLKDAQRGYEANVSAIETTKSMMNRTVDLMR